MTIRPLRDRILARRAVEQDLGLELEKTHPGGPRPRKAHHGRQGQHDDLVKAGVADPTKVVRVALQNAASVASFLLTTEALIAERPKHGTTTSDQENS